jgi:hypothetical protein
MLKIPPVDSAHKARAGANCEGCEGEEMNKRTKKIILIIAIAIILWALVHFLYLPAHT